MTAIDPVDVWVVAAQGGDRLALAKLLAWCHPRLYHRAKERLGPSMLPRHAPEDILQEVYLDVAGQLARFDYRGPGSFLAWAYAILDHKILDARRAAHARKRDLARELRAADAANDSYGNLLDHLYAEGGTPSRVARRDEALGALLASLSGLSEDHRDVLRLRFLEGVPVEDVAARLGRSRPAVVALTQRALLALRRAMDELGEFTHGG